VRLYHDVDENRGFQVYTFVDRWPNAQIRPTRNVQTTISVTDTKFNITFIYFIISFIVIVLYYISRSQDGGHFIYLANVKPQ